MAKSRALGAHAIRSGDMSFPIRDQIRPMESGQGYALRMASENHLVGLQQVKRWLGRSQYSVLDGEDAPILQQWFGADVDELRFALGRIATGRGERDYEYAGQAIGRSYFVNRSYPRICPACIEGDGICRLAWDVSLVVACERHGGLLVDRCHYCQKFLTWNRPAVDTCVCSTRLVEPQSIRTAEPLEIQFSDWVSRRIDMNREDVEHEAPRPQSLTALMSLLWPLSLDGGLHIAYALGTAAGYESGEDSELGAASTRPREQLQKARQMLRRAGMLSEKIAKQEILSFRVSRPSVVIGLLAEAAAAQASPQDRSLAHSLLLTIMHQKSSKWSGTHPQLSQISLF